MEEENKKRIGVFGIGIEAFQQEDGKINYEFNKLNANIPPEVIIMQLKRFIKNLKSEYFSSL